MDSPIRGVHRERPEDHSWILHPLLAGDVDLHVGLIVKGVDIEHDRIDELIEGVLEIEVAGLEPSGLIVGIRQEGDVLRREAWPR